ncbi:glycosyltransferase family 2 protein [Karstenula rhodostoma CBS 690.94]|uniref:Glycosyltransferase family 2 protein n=1 Tax=Karstenula rhodostoma CBS 690.94 TaxID=1392251 RepID=A0A9P4PVE3_9PLEO|nr:glycosyltransferase family 2 protein [Karstenula rhodostoma CBS 690.94]
MYRAWDVYHKVLTSYLAKKYRTVPLPSTPSYHSSDVSIIVPTIETESSFTDCVRLWLRSNPREIIIVTVPRYKTHVEHLVQPMHNLTDKITILIAPVANKRQQIMMGAKKATGKIIALVDDDAYWRSSGVIPYMLAAFEDASIGAVAGLQSPEIPIDRQDAGVVTIWEAAAALDMFKMNHDQPVRFTADGSLWVLSGRTVFIRAAIMQDPPFAEAYTHQVIDGKIVNGADDVWVTEWVLDHDWKICVQNAPEAEILTNVPRDWKFVLQNLRWDRGNFRSFCGRIFGSPGYRAMMQRHPHLTMVMIEKLTRPVWASAYVVAWSTTLWTAPWLATTFLLWMTFGMGGSFWTYRAFVKEYPYMAGKVWKLMLMSNMGPIMDIYALITMKDDRWLTRVADAQHVKA